MKHKEVSHSQVLEGLCQGLGGAWLILDINAIPKKVTICKAKSSKHAIDEKTKKLHILLGHESTLFKKTFFNPFETKTNLAAALYIANIRQKIWPLKKRVALFFTKAQLHTFKAYPPNTS